MSSITTRAAAHVSVLALTVRERAAQLRDEDGQVSVEWVGILALVGTIIAAIIAFDLDGKVGTKVSDAFSNIFDGGSGGGTGGGGAGAQ
jgi:Flp pilus assembly pilin Flp